METALAVIENQAAGVVESGFCASWVDRFALFIDGSQRTVSTYLGAVKQFITYLKANAISNPRREDVLSFRESLRASQHKPTTIQSYLIAVRLFFSWLEQEKLYPNIAEHIKGAKLNRDHKRDYLTSSQMKDILAGVDRNSEQGARDYAILCLMVTCGLRTIEVIRANAGDLRTLGDDTVLYLQGKGREERTDFVKIPAAVEVALRNYFQAIGGRPADEKPLFISLSHRNLGQRLTTKSISRLCKTYFRGAGFDSERLTAHSLRHTAVTLSLLGGQTLQEAQQFARHANISTTQIYAHNLDRAANKCSATVANAIFNN